MSKLLINEHPLQVLPSLACHVGLNEAIVLQQVHYWLGMKSIGKEAEGRKWVRNSVREWREENFPFWSEDTVQRTLSSLVKKGALLSRNDLSDRVLDRSLWYSINYEWLDQLLQPEPPSPTTASCGNGSPQNAVMDHRRTRQCSIYTETTTETTTTTPAPAPENLVAPQPPPLTEESMAMLGLTTPDKWFGATRNWRAIGVDANRIKVADAGMTLAQQTELVNTLADIYGTRALIDQGQDDSELLRLQGLVLILWGMHEKYRTVDGLRALHDVWKQTHANWAFPAGKQFVNFASQCLQESGEKKANDNPTRQQATTRRPATNSGIDYTELAREKQRQLQASLPPSSGMAGTIDF